MVKDISPGTGGSRPGQFTVIGTRLYFTAYDEVNWNQVWQSNGTEAGTTILGVIAQGALPAFLTNAGGRLYFKANDGVSGNELYGYVP